jgi:hypothetical protein
MPGPMSLGMTCLAGFATAERCVVSFAFPADAPDGAIESAIG